MKVYGLLTDIGTSEFFAFDPVSRTFYQDPMVLMARKRLDFMQDMIGGACFHDHYCDIHFIQLSTRFSAYYCRDLSMCSRLRVFKVKNGLQLATYVYLEF
jgi:hypothetical protein